MIDGHENATEPEIAADLIDKTTRAMGDEKRRDSRLPEYSFGNPIREASGPPRRGPESQAQPGRRHADRGNVLSRRPGSGPDAK
jgi:hypothetical protein